MKIEQFDGAAETKRAIVNSVVEPGHAKSKKKTHRYSDELQ